jgi:large subunit ribosomal protein L6
MSKIGKKPITIPDGVQINISEAVFTAKGPKGEQKVEINPRVKLEQKDNQIIVSVKKPDEKADRSLWGTFRSLINNAILGVTDGFERRLEVVGVGYKAAVSGEKLVLNLGFSHPVEIGIPKGLEVAVEKNSIIVKGVDKQMVGEFAANVRKHRKPEPYKGKGIKYDDEVVRRKAGKVAKAVGEG